ncbi:cell wall-binding protein [Clostridium chromiireducens]|uniref:Cell wall-binding protein n=1 Tax=Clostridium chromiireducens TaxID=225345 RepID=A0A964W2B9_9CLOT|nr:cadherin-like beta sandwich domain-containing protein [Clostridium chromiireducens]MVX63922.1 cell wall-binding protein [Clostridium chromiireducens]
MEKMKKRFIALLVIFTSIISFLPEGFIEQAVSAATIGTDATAITVTADGAKLTPRTDTTTSEKIYSTTSVTGAFTISLSADDITDRATLESQAKSGKKSTSGIVAKRIDIMTINGTSWQTVDGNAILVDQGISIGDAGNSSGSTSKIVGKVINGLPLGVNRIEYKITITTQDVIYTPADSANNTIEKIETQNPVPTTYANDKITVEHGTQYVVGKINPMMFNAYVGESTYFDTNTGEVLDTKLSQNNTVPFLYSTVATPDKSMPLRYTFDVPDSTSTLKYNMTFDSTMSLTGAKVYKNGKPATEGTEYKIDGHMLIGNLERLGQSDLIVVRLSSSNNSNNIQKVYSIEIKYNNLNADSDYSLKEAGITKADYNDDSSVLAYVGKKFDVTTNTNGFKEYSGKIYVDPRARLISIDPTLIKSKDTVAYVVTNRYTDSTGTTRVAKSELKNGEQYIDFMASSTSNIIQIDVYAGKDGSVTNSSKILARYLLTVYKLAGSSFSMNLAFDNNDSNDNTYLTQPGVKDNIIDDFITSRRTYDLYTKNSDMVNVSFTGARSNKNEYIRVWLSDSVDGNNLVEATASVNNGLDSSNKRSASLDVSLNKAKKIVIQAYYDNFYTTQSTAGTPNYESKPLGDKYVFYLPNNYDNGNPGTGEDSNEASLNSLKINGYTLTNSDGNQGFSSDKYSYTTTVAKEDTTEKITVVPQDTSVKSIVGTIDGSNESYDLVSGEAAQITLNSSGKTTLKIVVTAQDGTTSKTYTVVIKNNTKGSDATLKNVILNTGDYTFDPTADVTKVRVDQNITSVKVTPVPQDSKSTTTVNGEDYTATPISVSIRGAQKTEIQIVVTSEDGTESNTYTLEVYRVDSSNWNDDSDGGDQYDDDQFYDEYNDCWVDLTKYEEWGTVNGKPAYFDKKNRQVKDAWISTGGKYYYLNNLGYRASGWKVDNKTGQTYYLDPATGEMRKGWMTLNNSWYYLGQNGLMQKGWVYLNGKWYYFTPNGQMAVNQTMYVDGKVYNFGQDGAVRA